MSAVKLLIELRKAGVIFSVEGSQLRFEAPHGHLTKELTEQITAHRDEIIKLLNMVTASSCVDWEYLECALLPEGEVQREQDERLKAQEAQYAAQLRAWDREDRAAEKRRRWMSHLPKLLGMLVIFAGLWVIGGPWLATGALIVLIGIVIIVTSGAT